MNNSINWPEDWRYYPKIYPSPAAPSVSDYFSQIAPQPTSLAEVRKLLDNRAKWIRDQLEDLEKLKAELADIEKAEAALGVEAR